MGTMTKKGVGSSLAQWSHFSRGRFGFLLRLALSRAGHRGLGPKAQAKHGVTWMTSSLGASPWGTNLFRPLSTVPCPCRAPRVGGPSTITNPDIHVTIFTDVTGQDRHWGAYDMLKLGSLYPAGTPTVQASAYDYPERRLRRGGDSGRTYWIE
ncbi:hypothetical protein BO94DRAFT_116026 [Aspergillus sclerotioniger CBS 115572]|uniref:Uncharacterized protein n=1 Tax=Aspergillus sclerotioniger CBS 115572 TaxID=1450535 RepID=A0A317WCA4_9EURO|nr:hypothetical protein BO94DRAFT_116026 [Aspergillus sclerotioniger CBS 115572]PWY83859.1 hypothetical protein BO94DRAFT_116026 [Aspergillus sclerotioniger CBS 115572]